MDTVIGIEAVAALKLAHWVAKEVGGTPEQNMRFAKDAVAHLRTVIWHDDTRDQLEATPSLSYRMAQAYGQENGWSEWDDNPLVGNIDDPQQFMATQAEWERRSDEQQTQTLAMSAAIDAVIGEYLPPQAEEVDVTGWRVGIDDDGMTCSACGGDIEGGVVLTLTRQENPFLNDDDPEQGWETFYRHKECPPPEE